MMIKPFATQICTTFFLLITTSSAIANTSPWLPDGISYGYGYHIFDNHDPNIRQSRLGLRWQWEHDFLASFAWRLNGYFELGLGQWLSLLPEQQRPIPQAADQITQISFTPVFRLTPEFAVVPQWQHNMIPFIDVGLGISYQSEQDMDKNCYYHINMGGSLQAEFRMQVGVQLFQRIEFSYGWFHYSNAELYSINEGMDFQNLSLTLLW